MSDRTPQGWLLASASAEALLWLEYARREGFVAGGPPIDVKWCQQTMDDAEALGVVPTERQVEDAMRVIVEKWTKE